MLFETGVRLLDAFDCQGPFRLVGMAAYDLAPAGAPEQLQLFDGHGRVRRLECTVDDLIRRFGRDTVLRARDLGRRRTVTSRGLSPTLDCLGDDSRETRENA